MSGFSEDVIGFYCRHATDFDRERRRALHEGDWLDRFTALLPKDARVLDLGCGMGEPIAHHLISLGYSVTGVDSSPPMIDFCRSRFPGQSWHVADMRLLALDETFDGIIAWDSFFHLTPDDQAAMFPIFALHAGPGAPLLFTSGPRRGEAIGDLWGEKLYHASLDPAEYEALLNANGFGVVDFRIEDPDCDKHTVWLARKA